ncbi:hypothetical protein GTP45_25680 [Pseudoduganella sp. FT55W]|uniref:Uncharacterized protein n=1 Tax=Duganella rivi TaxID=2666083 RepID=A0A7X4GX31_9BURK|nr:hypothetical protein [Duganella rivi]MYM70169.1 hypothetical protein [Duganella rivi]
MTSLYLDRVWSGSVDLAHHYALVVRLMEHGHAAFSFDPSLNEMNVYPRLAHHVAAGIGRWLESPFMGVQVLAVLSVAAVWAALAWLLTSLPLRVAAKAVVVLAGLLALNRWSIHMPLHGDEVINNFFLPQLLGQVLCVAIMLLSLELEKRAVAAWLRYGLLAPAIYWMTGLHLLPALTLLLMMGGLIALDLLQQWRRRDPSITVSAAVGVACWLAALGALISHPAFAAMREISKANGYLPLPYLDNVPALMGYSVVIVLVSVALLFYWARLQQAVDYLALKWIGLYGLAIAAGCLAQGVALWLGMGSDYAIRKYVYALDTALLLELALLPALLWRRKAAAAPQGKPWALAQCVLPALLMVLACAAVVPDRQGMHARDIVALERAVTALRDRSPAISGKSDYATGLPDASGVIEYMFSIGLLHVSRMDDPNSVSLLHQRDINSWHRAGRVIVSAHSYYDQAPACRLGAPLGGLVALDAACAGRHVVVGRRIEFSGIDQRDRCILSGFSVRERDGTWTDAGQAILRCPRVPVSGKAPGHVELTAAAFRGDLRPQQVQLSADGLPQQQAVYRSGGYEKVLLPLRADASPEVVIVLNLPDAASPKQLGLGQDGRRLGLFVQSIEYKE